jgi:hypothetical protein
MRNLQFPFAQRLRKPSASDFWFHRADTAFRSDFPTTTSTIQVAMLMFLTFHIILFHLLFILIDAPCGIAGFVESIAQRKPLANL